MSRRWHCPEPAALAAVVFAWMLSLPAQSGPDATSGSVDVELVAPVLDGVAGPAASRTRWLAELAELTHRRTRTRLGLAEPFAPARLAISCFADREIAERHSRTTCEVELTGDGVLAPARARAVLHVAADRRKAQALGGAVAATIATLTLQEVVPPDELDRLGYGFLASALAHEAARAVGDTELHPIVRGALREPVRAFGGDLLAGCRGLLERDRLPRLADLLATEASDFDPEQHAAAFAFVSWLATAGTSPTTGEGAAPTVDPIVALFAEAQRGRAATSALETVLRADLATVDERFRAFVRRQPEPKGPRPRTAAPLRRSHPHAALFVYVREPVPERHRAVVQKALDLRAAGLTSGFADDDGRPRVRLGPVNQRVHFWHGDERSKSIDRAWPFVVVLEYEPAGEPEAVLECYRRVRGRADDAGWMLDPTVGFVEHHNAQLAVDRDARFAYLAVPDTPTGTRIGESEFVHRARVRWKDGKEAALGLRTTLEAFASATTDGYDAEWEPLVDWQVLSGNDALGITAIGAVDDLRRRLAPFAMRNVFAFPDAPPGLRVGR